MNELLLVLAYLLTAFARLLGPGGAKALGAENLLVKLSYSSPHDPDSALQIFGTGGLLAVPTG